MPVCRIFPLRTVLVSAFSVLLLGGILRAQTIPSFPSAEGAGAYAKGGRGGDVYHVTNTNASGPGSLAYGLTTDVPSAGRTIVFDVSGYTTLSSVLRVTASKITIAGQTAPGDGFGIKGNTFRISGDDIVIRHMRFRSGHTADAINLDSGSINSIFDHCDAMFSGDENFSSFNSPPENMTWQWSLNAWGRESHSCGGLWDQAHATGHHSLWAHNHTRNPKARPSVLDWTNNVTFDWDIGFIMGDSETPANWNTNIRGNYFVCPPGNIRSRGLEKARLDRNGRPNFSIFVQDNLFDKDGDGLLNGQDYGYGIASGSFTQLAAPLANNGVAVTIDNPLTAYKKVVSAAGPLQMVIDPAKPLRDEAAAILIHNLVTQRRHHISSVSQTGASNGGYATLLSAAAPIDTDRDGMPDFYETALGWNAATQDHNTALASSGGVITGTTFFPANTPAGYTRLEEYLHYKAIPHGTVARNISGSPTSLQVDLRKFTSGFASSPVFTVSSVVGGSVVQSGTGGNLATFTPTLNYTGRARFEFTVTDAQGSTWTQTCAFVVTNTGLPRDLVWKGSGSEWNSTAANWLRSSNGSTVAFSDGDRVAFDQSGFAQPSITVTGTLVPTTVEVNSAGDYTFGGTGSIASTGTLTKRGTGTLTLAQANTYAGGGSLEAGAIHLANGGSLGGGTLLMLDGTIFANVQASGNQPTVGAGFDVPAGNEATIQSGNRIVLSGSVTGEGTLNYEVQTTVNRADIKGQMAAFAGNLNFNNSGTGGVGVRLFFNGGSFNGFGSASVDVGGSVSLQPQTNSGGNTLNIGALSGSSAAANLSGGTAGAVSYVIGAKNLDTTFAGTITGNASLTKTGSATLTLSGANTYTGVTNVNAGWLLVNGSLGNTAVTVASGANLGGSGTLGGSMTANAGAILSPGTTPFTGAPMTVNGGLSLNGATLYYDMSSSPAGANDKIVMNGGTLGLSGTQHFQFWLADGTMAAGTYDLITGATNSTVSNVGLTHNLPAGARQTFTLSRSAAGSNPSYVRLTVTGNPATLTWTGVAGTSWDTTTVNNWTGATPNTFSANDAVVFDDTSAVNTVTIPNAIAPRAITFNNSSKSYTLGGTGALTAGALVKNGAGSLVLTSANSSWSATINAGATITLANDTANGGALGSGPITLNGGALTMFDNSSSYNSATYHLVVPEGRTGTLNADSRCDLYGTLSGGGTINFLVPWVRTTLFADWSAFTGTINVTTDADGGDLRMGTSYNFAGFPSARVHLADRVWAYYTGTLAQGAGTSVEIGELSGQPLSRLLGGQASSGARALTYYIGGKGTDATFAGTIAEQDSAVTTTAFVKRGAGIWTLSGTCSWNGGTAVEEGTLRVSGSLTSNGGNFNVLPGATLDLAGGEVATADLQIEANGRLTGRGSIKGDLTNNGDVTCNTGTLTVTGDVVNNGTMRFTGGAALNATGRLVNNGVLDLLTGAQGLPQDFENNGIIIDSTSLSQVKATKSGSTVTVSVQTYVGHAYHLQHSDSLISPSWSNVGATQQGDGTVRSFTDPAATGTQRFYRVVVNP